MRLVRRTVAALAATAIIAGIVRLRGTGGVPPRRGGWREIPIDELT